jgi:phosphatidylinositol glycan class O
MVQTPIPKPAPGNQDSIAAQYARAKALKDAQDAAKVKGILSEAGLNKNPAKKTVVEKLNEWKAASFGRYWGWVMGVFVWFL